MIQPTNTSRAGMEFLTELEGRETKPYKCSADKWTAGVGHVLTPAEIQRFVVEKARITPTDINQWLDADLDWAEKAVNMEITVPLNQQQFDALVCLCFNIGATAFAESTVVKRINSGYKPASIIEAWHWWNKVRDANGELVFNQGLANRRAKETKLYFADVEPTVEDLLPRSDNAEVIEEMRRASDSEVTPEEIETLLRPLETPSIWQQLSAWLKRVFG